VRCFHLFIAGLSNNNLTSKRICETSDDFLFVISCSGISLSVNQLIKFILNYRIRDGGLKLMHGDDLFKSVKPASSRLIVGTLERTLRGGW